MTSVPVPVLAMVRSAEPTLRMPKVAVRGVPVTVPGIEVVPPIRIGCALGSTSSISGSGELVAFPLTLKLYGFSLGSLLAMLMLKLQAPAAAGVRFTTKVSDELVAMVAPGWVNTLAAQLLAPEITTIGVPVRLSVTEPLFAIV